VASERIALNGEKRTVNKLCEVEKVKQQHARDITNAAFLYFQTLSGENFSRPMPRYLVDIGGRRRKRRFMDTIDQSTAFRITQVLLPTLSKEKEEEGV